MRVPSLAAAALVAVLAACGPAPPAEPPLAPEPPEAAAAVRRLQQAFERHDVEALIEHVTDDVEWLRVDGETVSVETLGRDALRDALERDFASQPDVRSVIEELFDCGAFVAVRERVTWRDQNQAEHMQIALAVYEVDAGKVRRVWYYPAQPA